jgi:hypothetical protein
MAIITSGSSSGGGAGGVKYGVGGVVVKPKPTVTPKKTFSGTLKKVFNTFLQKQAANPTGGVVPTVTSFLPGQAQNAMVSTLGDAGVNTAKAVVSGVQKVAPTVAKFVSSAARKAPLGMLTGVVNDIAGDAFSAWRAPVQSTDVATPTVSSTTTGDGTAKSTFLSTLTGKGDTTKRGGGTVIRQGSQGTSTQGQNNTELIQTGQQGQQQPTVSDVTGNVQTGNEGDVTYDSLISDIQGWMQDMDTRLAGAPEEARAYAQGLYTDAINALSESVDSQISDLQRQSGEVDPQYSKKLQDLKAWADNERAMLNETMNKRGVLQSGISIEALKNLTNENGGKLSDAFQWAENMKNSILSKIASLRSNKAEGIANYNAKTVAAGQDYLNNIYNQTNSARNNYTSMLSSLLTKKDQSADRWFDNGLNSAKFSETQNQNIFNNGLNSAKFSETQRHNGVTEGISQQNANTSASNSNTYKGATVDNNSLSDVTSYFISKAINEGWTPAQVSAQVSEAINQGLLTAPQAKQILEMYQSALSQ